MSSIFNKFKDLNKGVECALNLLLVINRTAFFCNFIKGFNVVLEAAPHVKMQWLWIIVLYMAIVYGNIFYCFGSWNKNNRRKIWPNDDDYALSGVVLI